MRGYVLVYTFVMLGGRWPVHVNYSLCVAGATYGSSVLDHVKDFFGQACVIDFHQFASPEGYTPTNAVAGRCCAGNCVRSAAALLGVGDRVVVASTVVTTSSFQFHYGVVRDSVCQKNVYVLKVY